MVRAHPPAAWLTSLKRGRALQAELTRPLCLAIALLLSLRAPCKGDIRHGRIYPRWRCPRTSDPHKELDQVG